MNVDDLTPRGTLVRYINDNIILNKYNIGILTHKYCDSFSKETLFWIIWNYDTIKVPRQYHEAKDLIICGHIDYDDFLERIKDRMWVIS